MPKTPCSEAAPPALVMADPRRGRLIVLEGMPGAGKTTAVEALAVDGHSALGEYITPAGAVVPIDKHPAVDDDAAHQANWLTKARRASELMATGSTVYCDRDWLSALAYAYSLTGERAHRLREVRTAWAAEQLRCGRLLLPDAYVIYDLGPQASAARRGGGLRPEHPWWQIDALVRLREFYAHPAGVVALIHPDLAERLHTPAWHHVYASDPLPATVRRLCALAVQR
jgi:predicted ATPase